MINKKFFRYRKSIDSQIVKAAEEVLKIKIIRAVKMKHGEVNHVYKLVSEKGNILARIFQYGTWPEIAKLTWIEHQLAKNKIPHAKILYITRAKKFFPFGFMLTEFIEGPNGNQAVKQKKISFSEAFYKTGQILKKVHSIKLKEFGSIGLKNKAKKDFIDYKLWRAKNKLRALEKDKAIKTGIFSILESKIKESLLPFKNAFSPVLEHADANRENAILNAQGQWVLIDWDNAYAGIWLEDYAELTYWVDWQRKQPQAKRMHTLIKINFFKGYGKHQFNFQQISLIEKALHIIKAIHMMSYYYYTKQSKKEYNKTKNKFLSLLR